MKYEHTVISGDEFSVKADDKILKDMSNKGWELVAVIFNSMSNSVRLYFKRPIEEKQVL